MKALRALEKANEVIESVTGSLRTSFSRFPEIVLPFLPDDWAAGKQIIVGKILSDPFQITFELRPRTKMYSSSRKAQNC